MIERKAHLQGYRTQKDLVAAIGKTHEWLCRRYNGAAQWGVDDLIALDNALRFDATEMAQLVRCR